MHKPAERLVAARKNPCLSSLYQRRIVNGLAKCAVDSTAILKAEI
jgi:hypothetical protein